MIYNFIPYGENKDLGKAYNDHMKLLGPDDWGLLIDHDVSLLTYDWYDRMKEYIKKYPRASAFTCYTNRIGCPWQILPNVDKESNDIHYHRNVAKLLTGLSTKDVSKARPPMSGFLMLVSQNAWWRAGGFKEGAILGVDNDFHNRLVNAHQKIYLMKSIYVYHYYRNNTKNIEHLI